MLRRCEYVVGVEQGRGEKTEAEKERNGATLYAIVQECEPGHGEGQAHSRPLHQRMAEIVSEPLHGMQSYRCDDQHNGSQCAQGETRMRSWH